jgi:hypothetical protein
VGSGQWAVCRKLKHESGFVICHFSFVIEVTRSVPFEFGPNLTNQNDKGQIRDDKSEIKMGNEK